MLKKLKNSRGVALLLVLGTLMVLTTVVVQFAYDSQITYNAAFNQLDRSQAYYLAQSGLGFAKLLLKYDQEIQKIAAAAAKRSKTQVVVPPLYEMVPINTAMIRALMGSEGLSQEVGEDSEEAEIAEEESSPSAISFINLEAAEEFLNFKGDFSLEIREEDARLNLNTFYSTKPTQAEYDMLKGVLYQLLSREEFAQYFEDRYRDAKDLSQSIADYIDPDDSYNEPGGSSRGREGLGAGDSSEMKNAKLLTVEELNKVPGMTGPIYEKLKNYVTVYGGNAKLNFCRAEEGLQEAWIMAYAEAHPQLPEISPESEDTLEASLNAVLGACPEVAKMESELISIFDLEEVGSSNTSSSGRGRTSSSGRIPKFTDLIKKDSQIYKVISTGEAGVSRVRIFTVIDTSGGNPKNYKEIYWRVL